MELNLCIPGMQALVGVMVMRRYEYEYDEPPAYSSRRGSIGFYLFFVLRFLEQELVPGRSLIGLQY